MRSMEFPGVAKAAEVCCGEGKPSHPHTFSVSPLYNGRLLGANRMLRK